MGANQEVAQPSIMAHSHLILEFLWDPDKCRYDCTHKMCLVLLVDRHEPIATLLFVSILIPIVFTRNTWAVVLVAIFLENANANTLAMIATLMF